MSRSTRNRFAIIVGIIIADIAILVLLSSTRANQLTQANDTLIQSAVEATVSAQTAAQARQSPTLTTPSPDQAVR